MKKLLIAILAFASYSAFSMDPDETTRLLGGFKEVSEAEIDRECERENQELIRVQEELKEGREVLGELARLMAVQEATLDLIPSGKASSPETSVQVKAPKRCCGCCFVQ